MALFFSIFKQIKAPTEVVTGDIRVFQFIREHRTVMLTQYMKAVSYLGNIEVICIGLFAGSAYFYKTRHWNTLIAFIMSTGGGSLFITLTKLMVKRERPSILEALAKENTFSFPSGHTFTAICFYGFLTYFIVRDMNNGWVKWLIIAASAVFIASISISRVYLGAHWLSDVVASVGAGTAWITAVITILQTKRRLYPIKTQV
jgi:undecaprenyl-diphosphatase